MTGTAMPPTAGTLAGLTVGTGEQQLSASFVNSFRVAAVAQRLDCHIKYGRNSDARDFFNLCLSLARGIDYAVANNEVPDSAKELPILLKQICQRRNDLFLQAAIMVLMISVKNACKAGWFSDMESQELFALANEIGSSFCSSGDLNPRVSNSSIPKIMARFYPLMKMGQILASLEVKPGYGAYVIDFHISKNTTQPPQEKIRLFVAQTDNIETSACIISPQLVNFLLNGKGVERRTNVLMDAGPQMPTNVTSILKYGTNLLQAVGQFNGHYVIIVAFMSMTSFVTPVLPDYVQPAVATLDSDSDIIEGPSRISLNCPISYKRIKTPVKGHSCKHLQCFDFKNFIDINSRRPSWRCPHCNQQVCNTDIRLDQNMVKVLSEVGDNVLDVIISADGSWKAVLESDDPVDQALDKTLNCQKEVTEQQELLPVVLDLTGDDDEMDAVGTSESEDRKPVIANLQSQYVSATFSVPSVSNNAVGVNHNAVAPIEDEFWSGFYFANPSVTSSARSDAQIVSGISEPTSANLSPVSTDAVSPALNREAEGRINTNFTNPVMQNQFSAPVNMQLQQSQLVNSAINHEYGRLTAIPRHVTRTPIAVQALPAPSQTHSPQQRSRSSLNTLIPNGSSVASQAAMSMTPTANGFNTVSMNPPSSWQHQPTSQNWSHQDRSLVQPGQQVVGISASSQLQGAYRVSSGLSGEHQNLHQQQALNQRLPQSRSQSPGMVRPSSPLPRTPTQQGGAQVGVGRTGSSQPNRYTYAPQRQMGGQSPSVPVPVPVQTSRTGPSYPDGIRASAGEHRGNMGGTVQPVDLSSEQNWRPAGRMRGSLSGRNYNDALSQFMITPTQPSQPNQPTQAARPPLNLSSPPPSVPTLQALLANSRTANVPQTHK